MIRAILGKGRRFAGDGTGVIFYLAALLMVPLIVLAGVAVDIGQILVARNQLASAIDAAALNIAANPGLTQAQAQAQAQAFVNANFGSQSNATLNSLTVTQTPTTVAITASATVNTFLIQIIGYNTLSTTVTNQVALAQNYLEVALVLDNTGSMNLVYGGETGIQGLKDAATALVNTLFAADPAHQYVKIAVVPFTAAVNVGTQYANASWLDAAGAGSMTRENLNVPAGQGLISLVNELANASWGGCVRQRKEPYDIEDVAPTANNLDTLFTPYVAPSEPDNTFANYYLSYNLPRGTPQPQIQSDVTKYLHGRVQNTGGPNFNCPVQPIIRLTNNQAAIQNEIQQMYASGGTVIPTGLMWGWHVISPNGPFGDGVPYSDSQTVKVIILLTDGFNDVQLTAETYVNGNLTIIPPTGPTNGFNQSIYSSYGYADAPSPVSHLNSLQVPQGLAEDQADYNLDQKELQLCNNIKAVTDANGNTGRIIIYAIGFGNVINARSLQLLQQCATDAAHYFYNPTSEELIQTFQQIAIGLNSLRISK